MIRIVGAALVVAGVAAWLLQANLPHLALTAYVVEAQTTLGLPLAPVLGGAGLVLVAIGSLFRMARGRPVAERPAHLGPPKGARAKRPSADWSDDDWRRRVFHRAADLRFEAAVSLTLHRGRRIPFEMRLGDVPPERARRCIAQLAGFLAEVPRPGRVSIRFDGFHEVGASRKNLVSSAFARHFAASDFTVVPEGEDLAVKFTDPDPRWRD